MKYSFLLLLAALLLGSCTKDHDTDCLDGEIEYTGDPAADGLGWVLRTDTDAPRYYVLTNLPPDFQENNLAVHACISNTGQKMTCECAVAPDKYKVSSIHRR